MTVRRALLALLLAQRALLRIGPPWSPSGATRPPPRPRSTRRMGERDRAAMALIDARDRKS